MWDKGQYDSGPRWDGGIARDSGQQGVWWAQNSPQRGPPPNPEPSRGRVKGPDVEKGLGGLAERSSSGS